jgi:hypothetical protein
MSVCAFIVFVLPCVLVAAMWRADPPSKESYRLCKKKYKPEKEARAQRRTVVSLMYEWMNGLTTASLNDG